MASTSTCIITVQRKTASQVKDALATVRSWPVVLEWTPTGSAPELRRETELALDIDLQQLDVAGVSEEGAILGRAVFRGPGYSSIGTGASGLRHEMCDA